MKLELWAVTLLSLASLSEAVDQSRWSYAYNARIWAPRYKVNRLRRRQYDGDLRYASCEIHRPITIPYLAGHRNMYGNVFVEQKYDGTAGAWGVPQAFISVENLTDLSYLDTNNVPGQNDAQYNAYTFWDEEYDDIECRRIVNPATSQANAATGRTPTDGKVTVSSTQNTISTAFAFPDSVNPLGYNAPINNIFNTVVEINLQSDNLALALQVDDPIVLGCCKLQPTSQQQVSRYYRRYALQEGIPPTPDLEETLTTWEKTFIPAP